MTLFLPNGAPAILSEWCNPYGAETGGGRMLGGLSDSRPAHQWYCENKSIGRYRMTCEHGHQGQKVPLCEDHIAQFKKRLAQPEKSFCPRCNIPPNDHRCQLTLSEVS